MKPGSDTPYITFRDSQGDSRRKYLNPCITCGVERWSYPSKVRPSNCQKCSHLYLSTPERNAKIGETLRNKYKTDADFKRRVAAAKVVNSGKDHWNWKGGITPLTQRTRSSEESNSWTLAVLYRDSYTCRVCEAKSNLQAHHINGWAEFPEDRYIIENGLTLCEKCHAMYHKYERECRKNGNNS
jgi:5-methylcytosine-specific restriction endonuclease McrA